MLSDTIANVKISSSQRSITPSKLVTPRNITPQRPRSNPRASSAGKLRFGSLPEISTSSDVLQRAPSRSASRRKQRRWENMHIFSSEVNEVLMQELEDDHSGMRMRRHRFEIEIGSAFKKLFEPGNAAALEAFRMCAEKIDSSSSQSRNFSPTEQAWMNVEKRLRVIVIQSVLKTPDLLSLLADLERILIAFAHFDELDFSSFFDTQDDAYVLRSVMEQAPEVSDEGQLKFHFQDSAFHRLLLHSVSQFHRLTSKSFVGADGTKITVITKPKKFSAFIGEEPLSLTKFLHQRAMSGLRICQ